MKDKFKSNYVNIKCKTQFNFRGIRQFTSQFIKSSNVINLNGIRLNNSSGLHSTHQMSMSSKRMSISSKRMSMSSKRKSSKSMSSKRMSMSSKRKSMSSKRKSMSSKYAVLME